MAGDGETLVPRRHALTSELSKTPYNASLYLERAKCHQALAFPDLAASDAYKSLLLVDEVLNDAGEYHEQASQSLLQPFNILDNGRPSGNHPPSPSTIDGQISKKRNDSTDRSQYGGAESFLRGKLDTISRTAYEILTESLIKCHDLKGAWKFATGGLRSYPSNSHLLRLKERILDSESDGQIKPLPREDVAGPRPQSRLPENGLVRREIYPWNSHELDRYSTSSLSFLNSEIAKVAPKCEVRVVDLPCLNVEPGPQASEPHQEPEKTIRQLGVFAKCGIQAHETVLREPSTLTANNGLHDPLCDACSSPLPAPDPSHPLPACPDCDDVIFCSATCLENAQRLYHPAVCGLQDFDISTRDPSPQAATDALYLLLLARTIAMAETQDMHPLDLTEIKYLWGDFASPPTSFETTSERKDETHPSLNLLPETLPSEVAATLPFSFSTNIQTPIHLLENLGVDIFSPRSVDRFDTWVVNTLMAKYRGVASARMNPRSGMPEACAVHWRWSLANHSCAPNVRWEWPSLLPPPTTLASSLIVDRPSKGGGGCMALLARGGDDVVRWGDPSSPSASAKDKVPGVDGVGGIKEGEEILNHYCDVDLPVKERREWATGALGGECVCERCLWESQRGRS